VSATLRCPDDRAAILARLATVTPEDHPRWGVLDAPRMICHVSDALRVALGDLPAGDHGNLVFRRAVKPLILRGIVTPRKGKTPTAPEMLTSTPGAFPDDVDALRSLIDRIAAARDADVARHPMFGALTADEWARLHHLHLDHHLRQFGA